MRAWLIDQLNGIENARLTEVADPVPAAGEVLLRLTCAALNPADRYLAQGEYPARPPLPHILGRDGSGVVAGCGSGVQGHAIGDKRAILRSDVGVSRWGTFADLVTVPAESLIEIPDGWTDEQAGAASLVYVTAFQALTQWGDVLFIVHTRDIVLECKGPLPPGSSAQGYFIIHGDSPIGGHIKVDRCAAIYFIDRLFHGRRSCSLQPPQPHTLIQKCALRERAARDGVPAR